MVLLMESLMASQLCDWEEMNLLIVEDLAL